MKYENNLKLAFRWGKYFMIYTQAELKNIFSIICLLKFVGFYLRPNICHIYECFLQIHQVKMNAHTEEYKIGTPNNFPKGPGDKICKQKDINSSFLPVIRHGILQRLSGAPLFTKQLSVISLYVHKAVPYNLRLNSHPYLRFIFPQFAVLKLHLPTKQDVGSGFYSRESQQRQNDQLELNLDK